MNPKSTSQEYKQVFTSSNNHQFEYIAFILNHYRQITHFPHRYTFSKDQPRVDMWHKIHRLMAPHAKEHASLRV